MSRFRKIVIMIVTAGAMAVAPAASELSDTQWELLKAEKLARPRPLIINDDGVDAFAQSVWEERGVKNIPYEVFTRRMLDMIKGTKFTAVSYTAGAVGWLMSYPNQAGAGQLPDQIENDPMLYAKRFAEENQLEFFGGMRLNDIHDAYNPNGFPNAYKKAHPEYLFGTFNDRPPRGEWSGYDFTHQEIRDKFVAIVTEMMENYPVDGIDLDFYRICGFFKGSLYENRPATPQECAMMTDMIRQIRANAERIGRARRQPILLAFHLPDSPEVCRLVGLDVVQWMKEKLFDLYLAGGDRGYFVPAREISALCKKYGIKYYGVVNCANDIHADPIFGRNNAERCAAESMVAFEAGADGIYYFNTLYPGWRPELMAAADNLEALRTRNKRYFIASQHENDWGTMPDAYKQFNKLPELTISRKMFGAEKRTYILQVGDDFSRFRSEEMPKLDLYLKFHGGTADKIVVRLNGHQLTLLDVKNEIAHYAVDPEIVKTGVNEVELDTTATLGSRSGRILLLDKKPEQLVLWTKRPWWNIYPIPSTQPNKVLDNGYRFIDRCGASASLFYQLAGINGAPISVEFELKVNSEDPQGAATLRLADGTNVEAVDFFPDHIRLRFSGNMVKFNTKDNFHNYVVSFDHGKLTLKADEQTLMADVPLKFKADNPEAQLVHHHFSIPADGHTASLLFGAWLGNGKSDSTWRNLSLNCDALISDLVMTVTFPEK